MSYQLREEFAALSEGIEEIQEDENLKDDSQQIFQEVAKYWALKFSCLCGLNEKCLTLRAKITIISV